MVLLARAVVRVEGVINGTPRSDAGTRDVNITGLVVQDHGRGARLPPRLHVSRSSEGAHVVRTRESAATSSPLVRPPRLARTPWLVPRHRRTSWVVGARSNRWGTMRLTTSGRRTSLQRSVIIAYLEDGPNLVTMAMNGWADGEPDWWLNLQAHPNARVVLPDGPRSVTARAAAGAERSRLWSLWREIEPSVDSYAALRSTETAVVILEPAADPG